jgi:hypothetical protein
MGTTVCGISQKIQNIKINAAKEKNKNNTDTMMKPETIFQNTVKLT